MPNRAKRLRKIAAKHVAAKAKRSKAENARAEMRQARRAEVLEGVENKNVGWRRGELQSTNRGLRQKQSQRATEKGTIVVVQGLDGGLIIGSIY